MTAESLAALLVLLPISFLGSVLYGVSGFGSALLTVPLAVQFFPLPFVIAAFALVDLFNAIRVGLENPRAALRPEVVRMVSTMIPGIVVGTALLVSVPRRIGMATLGLFIAVYAVYALARHARMRRVAQRWAYLAGFGGGVTGTLFGAGGPPYAIYLAHRGLDKEQYRATLTMTSIFSIGLRVAAFLVTGLLLDAQVWIAAAIALPGAALGLVVARRIFNRLSRDAVMRVVGLVLLVTGGALLVRAAA